MVIAFAIGADAVIIGGALAGSSCVPEHVYYEDEKGYVRAKYFGMASAEAQSQRGGVKAGTTPEGVSMTMPVKGKTRTIINNLAGGIRSGLSFANACNLKELRESAEFIIRHR
jgi:IMP dehydrogenase